MLRPIVWIFLFISSAFAFTHLLAMQTALYWYYPGFDSVMHLWGGVVLALGVHSFSTFSRLHFKPTFRLVLATLLFFIIGWEIFEYVFNIHNTTNYVFDTVKDIVLGLGSGLITHWLLSRRTIKNND